jgi:ABC-2 type transport system ATP-binding protein
MGRAQRKARVDYLMNRFELTPHLTKSFRELSGGLKRRVVLARALVHDPKLIILDEPTAGVDVELRRVLWHYLTEINQDGRTILLTSHYLEEVERLCRQIAIVNKGRVVREGTKDEIAATPGSLENAYLAATGAQAEHVAGQ